MAIGPGIDIQVAQKRFAGAPVPLFADLRFEIAAGSVVALLGPSGVGKSSLLRMVAGVDNDYSGTITIGGVPAQQASPPGFVFQDSRLLPWLSARDNILAVRPQTGRDRAEAWLDRVGLKAEVDAYPHQLSGGMQRRVALARALSVNPGVLLLDEPFVSLDRPLVAELHALFSEMIEAEGSTAILVTHLPEDAARLADRVVMLSDRPARAIADLTLDVPRRARTAQEVLRLEQMLYSVGSRVTP